MINDTVSDCLKQLNWQHLTAWLSKRLSEKRTSHCLGVQQKATELATRMGLPDWQVVQAGLAGLLHDCAKEMPVPDLQEAVNTYGVSVSTEDLLHIQTLHAFVGAAIAEKELNIDDPVVLDAMRYHTTGRPEMSVVEKIVFIADKIEENTRDPQLTKEISRLIHPEDIQSLDSALMALYTRTVAYLTLRGFGIHPRTQAAITALETQTHSPQSHSHCLQ
ncbi:MAG: bis(5'-nucleosyl)-tetraphosphatase (symmetrical) YqeK [Cyanobacteria bacterium]|nr:bis(5'-nucleosyl)-tetraphosphatase (symmetrical) YqeK [Cyanobacteriota bacterium]